MPRKSSPAQRTEPQPRDEKAIQLIYQHDGVLREDQLRPRCYPDIADSTFHNRMRKLRDDDWIMFPTKKEKLQHALPEQNIYFLGVKGIAWIARQGGIHDLDFENVTRERARKQLAQQLLARGIYWKRKPWKFLAHHLTINDVRLAAFDACQPAGLNWDTWLPESQFRTGEPDRVTLPVGKPGPRRRRAAREETAPYYPDGVFWVSRPHPQKPDKKQIFAFVVEVDMGSKEGNRVWQRNIMPALAYLKSKAYKERTGFWFGRVLLVTIGPGRVDNLKALTEKRTDSRMVFFTTFSDLEQGNFFVDPLWRQPTLSDKEAGGVALIEPGSEKHQTDPPTPLLPPRPFASV